MVTRIRWMSCPFERVHVCACACARVCVCGFSHASDCWVCDVGLMFSAELKRLNQNRKFSTEKT